MQSDIKSDKSALNLLSRLNAVRLFVVLLITVGYASTMPQGPSYAEIFNVFGYDPSWFGIQLLFFISGLLAMRSVENGRTGLAYLSSRFWRNIPLLAVITILTLVILIPFFGTFDGSATQVMSALAKYLALTVSCVDPGVPLEGLFDDARYMCLVQGGLWTLRYGVILHIGISLAGRFEIMRRKKFVLIITIMAVMAYLMASYVISVKSLNALATPLTGLRLCYAFLIGMSAWLYRTELSNFGAKLWILPPLFVGIAAVNYLLPWTSIIEVSLTMAWISLCFFALFVKMKTSPFLQMVEKCPDLTLIILLVNWPICQVILQFRDEWSILPFIGYSTALTLTISFVIHSIRARLKNYSGMHQIKTA